MKIIPKYQSGGGFSSLFTLYTPSQVRHAAEVVNQSSNTDERSVTVKDSSRQESKSTDDDSKGKLTQKDLFSMIKDVNGLPNEMKEIVETLQATLYTNNLIGRDVEDLSTTYLNCLYQLKIANQNKIKFDDAVKDAKTNGSLGEVAITLSGNLMATDNKGNVKEITLQQYQNNPEQYKILTNSNLAWLRKYSPRTAFTSNDDSFEIISNGVGFESFQKALKEAETTLGKYQYTESGIADKRVLLGLKALQNASDEEKQNYIQQALDGNYSYTSTSNSNSQNIQALIGYMTAVLPKRMKVWASIKTGNNDENKATAALVGQYLMGKLDESSSYSVNYLGTDEKLKKASNSSSSNGTSDDPKKGFWQQAQTGQGGDEQNYNLMVGKGSMSVTGKYYGTTPGLEENTSLTKYIGNSKVGYLIKNPKNITFGDQAISTSSFDDVMVNSAGGAVITTLPITPDGKVNFNILKTYTEIETRLKSEGYKPKTEQFEKAKAQVLNQAGLGYLVDAQKGVVNPNYFGHFLILEGVASSKTKFENQDKEQNISTSEYVVNSADDALFDTVKRALSDKDKGAYDLDNNWITFNNDKLYKGNIYIPINQNALNAANADDVSLKSSQTKKYEEQMQRKQYQQQNWEKEQNKKPTSSSMIFNYG